jgi:hypothetical protein
MGMSLQHGLLMSPFPGLSSRIRLSLSMWLATFPRSLWVLGALVFSLSCCQDAMTGVAGAEIALPDVS